MADVTKLIAEMDKSRSEFRLDPSIRSFARPETARKKVQEIIDTWPEFKHDRFVIVQIPGTDRFAPLITETSHPGLWACSANFCVVGLRAGPHPDAR